jgi:hypothetical protein
MKSFFWKRFFINLLFFLFLFPSTLPAANKLPTDSSGLSWATLLKTDAYFWSGIKFGHKIFGGTHNGFQTFTTLSPPAEDPSIFPPGAMVH